MTSPQILFPTRTVRPPVRRGFALVVTLTLMSLLVILILGMLSLSTVELRTSGQSNNDTEARANARLAMMLAVGELQKHAGSDMRITAPADIIASDNPPLTGVWKSWEGSDHEPAGLLRGRPNAPDYDSKKMAISQDGRFISWLVSSAGGDPLPADAAGLVVTTASAGTVPLVSRGSLAADDQREVHVTPRPVGKRGAFAWWVSGENQKARLPVSRETSGFNPADWADRNRNHQAVDPEPFHLDAVLDDPSLLARVPTLATADFVADQGAAIMPHQNFHDLSANSSGLLTNVATGGWRKDLSLLTETWESQPTEGLELFQLGPDENLAYTRPTYPDNYRPPGSLFYAWSDYRNHQAAQTFHHRGPVTSWTGLANYATLYKEMNSGSASSPGINQQSWPYRGHPHLLNGLHKTWVMPQFARIHVIASHYATSDNAAPNKLKPAVLLTPIITLWNPYNVKLTLAGTLYVRTGGAVPIALKYNIPGAINTDYWAIQKPVRNYYGENRLQQVNNYQGWQMRFSESPMVLNPGETRVFSPSEGFLSDDTYLGGNGYSSLLTMSPGVRLDVGHYYTLDRLLQSGVTQLSDANPEQVSLPPGTMLDVEAKFDVPGRNVELGPVTGIFFQWNINRASDPQHGNVTAQYRPEDADILYPPLTDLASVSLAECQENPVPFLSMIFGSRIANDSATATKGLVQASPLVTFTATGLYRWFSNLYPGGGNPLNAPWDFSFIQHSSGPGDDMLPNVDNTTNSGYIITGVRKAEGIDRCVMSELPTRPLASLGDLTHWQVRGLNPVAPHGHNLIANSDATPLIPMDSVVDRTNNPYAEQRSNEQQDDAYCANHLLFDDWFFSSIAPDPAGFGPSGGTSLRDNYIDFLTGKEPLTNFAYRPIADDMVSGETDAGEIFSEEVQPVDSWKTIASRLEVRGMFNVNSTSVKAWRALLGHARDQKIPYITDQGVINLSDDTDYAFSRTSVAGDQQAGNDKPGAYFATTEFGGYRVFTDEMLDRLAENIVTQIRLRGPFLSLSEFVNRQLSGNQDLALAGAIQTALNQLAGDSSLDPFKVMRNESVVSLADPPGDDDYAFPKAAEGFNTYGLPGWTRQADILRPLAPVLSARDDTFTIRAYGETRAEDGSVLARAWCEASVRRTRNFLDPADPADLTTTPAALLNQIHGRRFEIISFRWLGADDV